MAENQHNNCDTNYLDHKPESTNVIGPHLGIAKRIAKKINLEKDGIAIALTGS